MGDVCNRDGLLPATVTTLTVLNDTGFNIVLLLRLFGIHLTLFE